MSGTEPLRGARQRPAGEPYLLGTDPEEGRRLERQHRAWAAAAHDLWDRGGFGPGARLLDLGCGPGFAALDLARRIGSSGRVLALDESPRFIEGLLVTRPGADSSSSPRRWDGPRSCGSSPDPWTASLHAGCSAPPRSCPGR